MKDHRTRCQGCSTVFRGTDEVWQTEDGVYHRSCVPPFRLYRLCPVCFGTLLPDEAVAMVDGQVVHARCSREDRVDSVA